MSHILWYSKNHYAFFVSFLHMWRWPVQKNLVGTLQYIAIVNFIRVRCEVWGKLLVTQLVGTLRYKPECRGFDSRCCYWNSLLI
jgi:hypothetical protein